MFVKFKNNSMFSVSIKGSEKDGVYVYGDLADGALEEIIQQKAFEIIQYFKKHNIKWNEYEPTNKN